MKKMCKNGTNLSLDLVQIRYAVLNNRNGHASAER